MQFSFDIAPDRRNSESVKWHHFEKDILPMWVADMDFRSPESVIQALKSRADHGIFGYPDTPVELKEVIVDRLFRHYQWRITPDDIVLLPGIIGGFNLAARTLTQPGAGLLIQTPVYMPFLDVAKNAGMIDQQMELFQGSDGQYEIDFDRFNLVVDQNTRMFLLCNPHNPIGRVFTEPELQKMAEICLRNGTIICSDEIHCDLIYSSHRHTPIATLDEEIAANTITLMAPSKTFNIPGLQCSFAVITNPELRHQYQKTRRGLVGDVNLMGYHAALAAYRDGGLWLTELLPYLEANRDFLYDTINNEFDGISMLKPDGTYLAWLDCREAGIGEDPCQFFIEHARVGLNNGRDFGRGGEGFVRLNFGCPRSTLETGLDRMRTALRRVQKA